MNDWLQIASYIGSVLMYGGFTILVYLFLICVVVGVHEFGHYQVARWCNIKILEFSIGFGKVLYQKEKTKDKTLFTLRMLPLGGFVKPLDKASISEEDWNSLPEEEKARAYNNTNRGKKILMILGGPMINFVLAFFLYLFAMMFVGSPQYAPVVSSVAQGTKIYESGIREGDRILSINDDKIDSSKEALRDIMSGAIQGSTLNIVTDKGTHSVSFADEDFSQYGRYIDRGIGIYFVGPKADYQVQEIMENSPAAKSGLQLGDIIKTVDGLNVVSNQWLVNRFASKLGEPVVLKILRDGQEKEISLHPEKMVDIEGNERVMVGVRTAMINIVEPEKETIGFFKAMSRSVDNVKSDLVNTVSAISKMFKSELSTKSLSGPVAILEYSGKAAFSGLYSYINLMALISVGIGFFNLLPLPLLDGGQVVVHSIEAARRKDFSVDTYRQIQFTGIIVMLCLFSFIMIQDMRNIFL